jgi:hypothetical protein
VTPRHPDTDGPIAGFAALPSDERMAEMIRSADLSMRDQWGRHRSRTSYYWRDMGHAVAVLLRNHLPLVEALRGLRLPAEPEAPTPANDCAGYGFGICPCGCHDQPVPTPEPPAEPDPCDGCGASRLSMRHYIGCPMASTHRWDPVVGTWVASNPRRDILDRLMELWQEPWSEPAFGEAQMLLARLRASQPVPTPERKGRITPIPELGIVALVEPVPTPEPPAEPEAPDLPNADYWRGWNVGFAVGNGDERVPDPAGTCPLCGGQGVVYDVTGTVEAAIREGAPFAAIPVPEWTGAVDPNTGVKEYGPISPASRPVPTPEPPAEPHYNAIHEDGTNGSIDRPASVPEAAPGLREALDEIESVLSDGWALRLTSRPTAGYRAEALYNDKVKVYVVAATPDGALRELSDVITESHVND